ncbi:MAG TPA: secretin N-terminal domain-containing protein, partial [Gemmatimonadales bacterium]|nr:secretin N-terminal domain-containing protein [Gemmatimonadales bacterium]
MTRLYRLMLASAAVFGVPSAALADGPASGEVTGVSVQASPGRADIVINVRGAVEVRDFMLESPNRLVLDVMGAKLTGNAAVMYDGVKRGGVLNLRYSQFQRDVVRIVLELDHAKDYHVERGAEAIRVSFGTDQSFLAWSSNSPSQQATARKAPGRKPEVQLPASRLTRAMTEEPRITVVWDRANIADVVAGFAAFSGRTIILGKDIKGEVSAEVKNQPWPQAFQAILASQGLSAQEMAGGIIRVDAPSVLAALDSLEPLETSVVRINYSKAADLTKSIEGVLTKGRGKVIADVGSNSLIITDTRSKVSSVADFVRGLDIRTPQVSIKAKIVF